FFVLVRLPNRREKRGIRRRGFGRENILNAPRGVQRFHAGNASGRALKCQSRVVFRPDASRQIFLSRAPFGVSSITQPLAFNSSRMASARLKSLAFRAALRSSRRAFNSKGIS